MLKSLDNNEIIKSDLLAFALKRRPWFNNQCCAYIWILIYQLGNYKCTLLYIYIFMCNSITLNIGKCKCKIV
jgi:hypothetical protein